jgi:hypothetical protein
LARWDARRVGLSRRLVLEIGRVIRRTDVWHCFTLGNYIVDLAVTLRLASGPTV